MIHTIELSELGTFSCITIHYHTNTFFSQPAELFDSFDPEPLGVASLAQVHRATLKNGKEVAVKVQHHYVRGNAKVDIVTMEYCVKIMSFIFPDFKFQWLVDESKKNLPVELDFMQEGRNTEKVVEIFANFKFIRKPLSDFLFLDSNALQEC
jgi:aarF domain-containing kinase